MKSMPEQAHISTRTSTRMHMMSLRCSMSNGRLNKGQERASLDRKSVTKTRNIASCSPFQHGIWPRRGRARMFCKLICQILWYHPGTDKRRGPTEAHKINRRTKKNNKKEGEDQRKPAQRYDRAALPLFQSFEPMISFQGRS